MSQAVCGARVRVALVVVASTWPSGARICCSTMKEAGSRPEFSMVAVAAISAEASRTSVRTKVPSGATCTGEVFSSQVWR